jgi:hypothetical protein
MSSVAQLQLDPDGEKSRAPDAWRSMAAFLVSGILMSFLGAILPAWGYHLRPSFTEVGDYFLVLALGLLLSVGAAHYLLPRRGLKFGLILASLLHRLRQRHGDCGACCALDSARACSTPASSTRYLRFIKWIAPPL